MAEELLEKIPIEKCWGITAKILSAFFVIRGENIIAPALGKSEGIISPVLGAEKWKEINMKIFGEGGRKFFQWIKENFDLPVEDAIGAANLYVVSLTLLQGPELGIEIVKATPEIVICSVTDCVWWNRYIDFKVGSVHRSHCGEAHQAWAGEGIKAVDSKLSFTVIKSQSWEDPHCELVIEFKED